MTFSPAVIRNMSLADASIPLLNGNGSKIDSDDYCFDIAGRSQTTQAEVASVRNGAVTSRLPQQLTRVFNADNARILAALLVLLFVGYHGLLRLVYGGDSCAWLLRRGELHGAGVWQPYGCMVHTYSIQDARRCLRYLDFLGQRSYVTFVGDSRVRQLYVAFVAQFGDKPPPHPLSAINERAAGSKNSALGNISNSLADKQQRHRDLEYVEPRLNLRVRFLWRPHVDASFRDVFVAWRDSSPPADASGDPAAAWADVPRLIVAGSATHAILRANGSTDELALREYAHNVSRIGAVMSQLTDEDPRRRVLWTLQQPVFYDRLAERRRAITNAQVERYNTAARQALASTSSGVRLWESHRLIGQALLGDSRDGLHAGDRATRHTAQLLINMYCNDRMNFNDGTCCSSSEQPQPLQIITFAVMCVCLVISLLLKAMSWKRHSLRSHTFATGVNKPSSSYSSPKSSSVRHRLWSPPPAADLLELVHCVGRLGVMMAYFFLCDRTTFFMKENRYFTPLNFWLPLLYIGALGLFFSERSRFTGVLHRDQTDEWKGWMQLMILVYHMTYASQVLPIYMHIRVLVSSYLFLTGYGHFMLFWTTGQLGIVRFFKVLFRMNMLTVVLCFVMNRPYQFYYFVPLVTFWYVMLYIMLAMPPRVTAQSSEADHTQYLYMVVKFVVFFSLIFVLFMSEVFFEKIFVMRPWKALYVTEDDDIHQWWFRCKLDRFSVGYGMVFAFVCAVARRHLVFDDTTPGNLASGKTAALALALATLAIGGHTTFTLICDSKPDCNAMHPFLVVAPIVGYIVLRNLVGRARTRFSAFFAWFGRLSLELFICQYHIWLAADTYGVLVLVPLYPVLNVLITSFIFVCVSMEVHRITSALSVVCVPNDWRLCVRNFALFLLILLPIAVHDGMF